jgi:endonuclease III
LAQFSFGSLGRIALAIAAVGVPDLLDRLESHYGPQEPCWPVDPYEFLIWWLCGYPASDDRCSRGWESLHSGIGIQPEEILAASQAALAKALKPGGMVPELRATRLQQIAERLLNEYCGDLDSLFTGPIAAVRKALKRFPNIADPGVDRILLFAHKAPVAAVPSNCPHVLVRIVYGQEREDYGVTYREAQSLLESEIPKQFHARQRAYLLLKTHGQTICKRKPQCERCPVRSICAYAAGVSRGGQSSIS